MRRLWSKCNELDNDFSSVEDECIILNPYYIESRYPMGDPKEYSRADAKEAISSVKKIISFVLDKMQILPKQDL